MNEDWQEVYKGPVTPGHKEKTRRAVGRYLDELAGRRERPTLSRIFFPALGLTFAGALAVAVVLYLPGRESVPDSMAESSARELLAFDAEMFRQVDLLRELSLLRNIETLEKIGNRKKWPKKNNSQKRS